MKTILVGYDGSDAAANAVRRAAKFAKAFDASVHVTSVTRVLVGGSHNMGPYDPADPPAEHRSSSTKHRRCSRKRGSPQSSIRLTAMPRTRSSTSQTGSTRI